MRSHPPDEVEDKESLVCASRRPTSKGDANIIHCSPGFFGRLPLKRDDSSAEAVYGLNPFRFTLKTRLTLPSSGRWVFAETGATGARRVGWHHHRLLNQLLLTITGKPAHSGSVSTRGEAMQRSKNRSFANAIQWRCRAMPF